MSSATETRNVKLTQPSDRGLRYERIFDATRDIVWRAYTEPDLIKQCWGRGNPLDIERFEFERGGRWRLRSMPTAKHTASKAVSARSHPKIAS